MSTIFLRNQLSNSSIKSSKNQKKAEKMCSVKKEGNLYILTLTGNDEHRLNPTLITSIRSSLAQIKTRFIESKSQPSALITTSQGKFFSNGYDIAWAKSSANPDHSWIIMDSHLRGLVHDLVSFPMPTIAAVTGHASAAGMILAMAHDYVIMRKERGYLYMSELDIGMVIPKWFMAMLRSKIADSRARWKVVLKAARLTAEMGREIGLVDEVGEGQEGTVEKAVTLGKELVTRGWDGMAYAKNREGLFEEVLGLISVGEASPSEEQVDGKTRSRL